MNVSANGFTLLEALATREDSEALGVFKTLTGGLLDHYRGKTSDKEIDQVSTEMILRSFKALFYDHDTVPMHEMLNPFLE